LKAVPFSIGASEFNSMLKEYDPKRNNSLDIYPAEMVKLFTQYAHFKKER
jgi:hypothetical protein